MEEVWKAVPQFEKQYSISTDGRMMTLSRLIYCGGGGYKLVPNRLMKLNKHSQGYRWVTLKDRGRQRSVLVHVLVLETFVGPCPQGMECRHLNGKRWDNRLENLCWGTSKENTDDTRRHGTLATGERCGSSKLTWGRVRKIRRLYSTGKYTQRQLADTFGLDSQMTVSKIVRGETWKEEVCAAS